MADDFSKRALKVFPIVAFICNRHLIDHMRRVSNDLGVDLETAYIWGIVAHLSLLDKITPASTQSDIIDARGTFSDRMNPLRLADISSVTGLPRETVRRKLLKLETQNKIMKTVDGKWVLVEAGISQKDIDFTIDSVKRLITTAKQIETLLSQVDART